MTTVDLTNLAVRERAAVEAKAALEALEAEHRAVEHAFLISAERVAAARVVAEKTSGLATLAKIKASLLGAA